MLLERDEQLRLLEECLTSLMSGRGGVALVAGAAAHGKTALLGALAERAVENGAVVLSAICAPVERSVPYGLIDQLLLGAAPDPDGAQPERRVARPAPGAGHEGLDVEAAREVSDRLLTLAAGNPVVIVVDDAHHADPASLQMLLYLRRRIQAARVLLVLAHAGTVRPEWSACWAELARQPHHRITIGPLTSRGVAAILGSDAQAEVVAAYHESTGGNPLLLRALREDTRVPGAAPVAGPAFRQATLTCVYSWEPSIVRAARGMAVLGDEATSTEIAELVDADPVVAEQAMDALAATGILNGTSFTHQAARSAILEDVPAAERHALHAKAAEQLYRRGKSSSRVAWHLVRGLVPRIGWAVAVLRDAAEHALATDQVCFAATCLSSALKMGVDDPADRLAVTRMLAAVHWRTNPLSASGDIMDLRSALGAGDEDGEAALPVVRHLLWHGDRAGSASVLTEMNNAALARTQSKIDVLHQWVFGIPAGDGGRFSGRSRPERAAATDPWGSSSRLYSAVLRGGAQVDAVVAAERILRSCGLSDETVELCALTILSLCYADRLDLAAGWAERLLAEATRRGATTWRSILGGLSAEIALRQGDLRAAGRAAETALDLLHPEGWGVGIGQPLSVLILTFTATGQHERTAELVKMTVPKSMSDTVFGLRYLHARGHHHLATDKVLAAVSDFEECGRYMREHGIDRPMVVPWRSDLAQAQLELGRHSLAKELVSDQLAIAKSIGARAKGISLRVLAASAEAEQRSRLLREAVDLLVDCGDRLQAARALADLSQVHHELGEFSRARLMFRRARQEAIACHPDALSGIPLLRSANSQEEPAAPQDEVAAVLSNAEHRVATLAALGHTNREIGRRLYVTVSTVEQHLTRVYRKLNVNNRTDLSDKLSQEAPDGQLASALP